MSNQRDVEIARKAADEILCEADAWVARMAEKILRAIGEARAEERGKAWCEHHGIFDGCLSVRIEAVEHEVKRLKQDQLDTVSEEEMRRQNVGLRERAEDAERDVEILRRERDEARERLAVSSDPAATAIYSLLANYFGGNLRGEQHDLYVYLSDKIKMAQGIDADNAHLRAVLGRLVESVKCVLEMDALTPGCQHCVVTIGNDGQPQHEDGCRTPMLRSALAEAAPLVKEKG